eukprot:gene13996-18771_t
MGNAASVIPQDVQTFVQQSLVDYEKSGLSGTAAEEKLVQDFNQYLKSVPNLASAKSKSITILQFNDIYNLAPSYTEEPIGGAGRFATVLKKIQQDLKSKGSKPLIVFSGDFVGPSLMSSVTQGAHLIEMLNHLQVDYATFGNHEFDFGYEALKNRLNGVDNDVQFGEDALLDYPRSTAKWISTNMSEYESNLPIGGKGENILNSDLIEWKCDGDSSSTIKIGFIGIAENWLDGCSQLADNELKYNDFIEVATRVSAELKAKGAEIVIAITHNRLENDYKLTEAVPGIDLLLGGHDHFYKADLPCRIVKSGEEWRWLSEIKITLKEYLPHPIISLVTHNINSDILIDHEIDSLIIKYEEIAAKKFNRSIFTSAVTLDPREEFVRFKESTICNWVCDACAEDYSKKDGYQSADICMLLGFLFSGKTSYPAGPFTMGNLMSVFPRPCRIIVVELSGENIIKSLERGCKSLPSECGSLHHVSSKLSYTIIISKPNSNNNQIIRPKVKNVLFEGNPIQLDKIYSVAVADSMGTGDYGFTWMKTAPRIVDEEFAMTLQDLMLMYCKRQSENVVANPKMGRINIIYE